VATPDPVIPPSPETEVHSQIELPSFQDNISSFPHPPRSLTPSLVSSSPELEEDSTPAPEVETSISILLALTVIPLPAPILRVNTPTVPPSVNPSPAVTPVVA